MANSPPLKERNTCFPGGEPAQWRPLASGWKRSTLGDGGAAGDHHHHCRHRHHGDQHHGHHHDCPQVAAILRSAGQECIRLVVARPIDPADIHQPVIFIIFIIIIIIIMSRMMPNTPTSTIDDHHHSDDDLAI